MTVDASKADCHILDNPAESGTILSSCGRKSWYSTSPARTARTWSKEDEDALRKQQQDYCQEDTLAGRIYAWFETFEQDKVCSLQIYGNVWCIRSMSRRLTRRAKSAKS